MPSTIITSESNRLLDLTKDGLWVQSVMYFPTSSYLRDSWLATKLAMDEIHGLSDGHQAGLDKNAVEFLINSPSYSSLKELTTEAVKQGVVAGDVLSSIYLMHVFNLEEPSVNKAIHISKRFGKANVYGDDSMMSYSDSSIKKYRSKFKSVSHLWAAFRLNQAYPYAKPDELFIEKLPMFLEVAAGILKFGCSFIPFRARPQVPLLDESKMWLIPESYAPRNLTGGSFPDGISELLKDYDANEYHY